MHGSAPHEKTRLMKAASGEMRRGKGEPQQTEHLHATSACLWLDEQETSEATENLNKLPRLVPAEQRWWCPQTLLNSD